MLHSNARDGPSAGGNLIIADVILVTCALFAIICVNQVKMAVVGQLAASHALATDALATRAIVELLAHGHGLHRPFPDLLEPSTADRLCVVARGCFERSTLAGPSTTD
jgi:hypothetical protein